MPNFNSVTLVGHTGTDVEVKKFDNGGMIAKFPLAVTEKYNDQQGNKQENTDWLDIELSGKVAEVAEKYVKKGDAVLIHGKIKKDTWEDDQGNKRSKVKIRGFQLQMLSSKQQSGQSAPQETKPDNSGGGESDGSTDSLPF